MALVGEWIRRLGFLLRRRRLEEDLRQEMETHRALLDEPSRFGNMLRLRDEARDALGWTRLDELSQDTRFALKMFRSSPGFVLAAVVTLALGIGVNIGVFRLVNGLLLRPLYERPDEVVGVYNRDTSSSGGYRGFSYPNYRDLREGTTDIFASVAAFTWAFVSLDDGDNAGRTLVSAATANYFKTVGWPLSLGRSFTPEEERLGAQARVAILGYPFWERRGADPEVLGGLMWINGEPFTVVGVAPKQFTGTTIPGPELWLPLGAHDAFRADGASAGRRFGARDAHELFIVGRLRAETSIKTGAAALTTLARQLELAFPEVNAGYTFEMAAPSRLMFLPGPGGSAVEASLALLLMVMPAIVLLVTCLNLANLLLARGQVRRPEMAIRSSLGGGRWRLIRQLVTEGLLLALAGGAVGMLLSSLAVNALVASLSPLLPASVTLPEFGFDWRVLVGTLGLSLMATLVFGGRPAWVVTRRPTDLKRRIGEEGRRLPGGVRLGHALVIAQVALSLMLLTCGGLFLMGALSAARADPGFRVDGVLLAEVNPSLAGYDEARGRQLQRALTDRLRTVPGVEAVTIGSRLAFSSRGDSRTVAPAGVDPSSRAVDAAFSVVGVDHARVLGLPLLSGRDFSDAELAPGSSQPVAIIDDMLAERLWPGEVAIGRRIQFLEAQVPDAGRDMRVVGVVPSVKHSLGNPQPFPHVFVPSGFHYVNAMTLQIRLVHEQSEQAMLATIGRVIRGVDARVPVLRLETWRDHLDRSLDMWVHRAGARVFSAFAGIALLLAVVGVYGVKSYVLSCRTREFGIRIAMGAHPRALLWQVLREGGQITTVGLGVGVLLAIGAGRLLHGFLYGVDAVEPVVLVTAPLILLASSILASYIPAHHATKVDPTVALRSE